MGMRVYILNNGYLESDENNLIKPNKDIAGNKDGSRNIVKVPVYCVLIDSPEGKILFDSGCHPDASNGYWPSCLLESFPYHYEKNQRLENQLALVGVKPEDISNVIISHLHLDHAGNMHLFKHANVYVHKKDFEYAQTLVHMTDNPANHGAYIRADLEVPVRQYHLIEEDFEIIPGVEVITLPGHCPGVLGMVVHLEKSGTLIFPSDSIYTSRNYGPPPKESGIVFDKSAYFSSIEKVRRLAEKYNAKVMFSHDMELFKKIRKVPDCYD